MGTNCTQYSTHPASLSFPLPLPLTLPFPLSVRSSSSVLVLLIRDLDLVLFLLDLVVLVDSGALVSGPRGVEHEAHGAALATGTGNVWVGL